ncbi:hypothetical protein QMK38_04100 [Lysinibacillus fusiformis]|nr:hypothetical protein [Lysinibacillus fusiformis]
MKHLNDQKKGKFQVIVVVLMIVLLVAPFILFSFGHYTVAFVLFGIWLPFFSSILTGTKNKEVY